MPSNKSFKYFKKSSQPFYFNVEGAEVVYSVQRFTDDLSGKSSMELFNYYSINGITAWLFFFLIRSLYSSTVQAEILMDGSDSEKKYSQPLF